MTPGISLLESYKKAVYEKDVEAYASLFDGDVRVFDMWGAWSYEGIGSWKEMAKGWFAGLGADRDVVTWEDVQEQDGGDLVVMTAIIRFAAVSSEGKELRYLQNRLTWVLRKKGDAWKIIHQHSSSPVRGETMEVLLQR